jgi:hypothetical protein
VLPESLLSLEENSALVRVGTTSTALRVFRLPGEGEWTYSIDDIESLESLGIRGACRSMAITADRQEPETWIISVRPQDVAIAEEVAVSNMGAQK